MELTEGRAAPEALEGMLGVRGPLAVLGKDTEAVAEGGREGRLREEEDTDRV